MTARIDLPYFDVLLEGLHQGHGDLSVCFGRHVHWGYWDDAHRPDGTMLDFAAAAERLCRRVCDAGAVRDGQAILDVGCGFGGTLASLNERLKGVRLAGLNIDARQLERARREVHARPGNEIEFHEGDACDMPFPDASFDVVLAVECAFHFASRARFFAEVRRVLRPGGVLSLCDFLPSPAAVPLLRAQNLIFGGYVRNIVGPTDVSIPLARYLDLARAAGLSPTLEADITRNTLPTYAVLQKFARTMGARHLIAKWGVGAMGLVSRLTLLRYHVLAFEKPAKPMTASASPGAAPTLPGLPVLGNLLEFRGDPMATLVKAAKVNGSITRLRLLHETMVFVNDPALIREVLVERPERYARRAGLASRWVLGFLGDGLLTTDGEAWVRLRRASQRAFTPAAIQAVARRMHEAADEILGQWEGWSRDAKVVDLFPEIVTLTVAVSARALLGEQLPAAQARGVALALLAGQKHVLRHMRNPLLPPDAVPTPSNLRYLADGRLVERVAMRALARRMARPSGDESRDMLDVLLAYRDRETGAPLDDRALRDQIVTNFASAPENVATSISWCLYLLARHPGAEAAVRAELDGTPADEPRPQFQRVLEEMLRMYPGAPYFDRRALHDDTIGGFRVARGSVIVIAPYVLHRDERYWTSPERFAPERFLSDGEGRDNPAYMPFGLGPRRCIGERFATMLLETVLPMLLRRFRFERPDQTEVDIEPVINLRPRGGMALRVLPR